MKGSHSVYRVGIILSLLILLGYGFNDGLSRAQVKVEEFPYQRRLSKDEQKWIADQLRRMRLEEKVGQMIMVPVPVTFLNIESNGFRELRRQMMENRVGGIVLGRGGVYQAVMLLNRLQELARFPLFVAAEFEAGVGMGLDGATDFPWNMAVGATGDPMWAERQGAATAQEARALGVNVLLAPVADLSQHSADGFITVRAYGDDPDQVARFVAAFIRSAQTYGTMAAVKCFPGYGRATISKDGWATLNINREQMEAAEFIPFRAAIASHVGAVVVSPIAVPQLDPTISSNGSPSGSRPATLSSVVMTDVLRREMKFDGLILVDSRPAPGVEPPSDDGSAAVQAVKAGADVLIAPPNVDEAIRAIWRAVRRDEISEDRIDASVNRILTAKARLGLGYNRFTDLEIIDSFVSRSELQQTAQTIARKSMTLVRNDHNLIPLKTESVKSLFHVAVTNADTNAIEQHVLGRLLTVELQRKGLTVNRVVVDARTPVNQVPNILELARAADVVLVSLFIRPQVEGGSMPFPQAGAALLSQMLEKEQSVIVISFGNPYLLVDYPGIHTYLCAFGDAGNSVFSQQAVARALVGQEPIFAKLPVALPGLYPRGQGISVGMPAPDKN